MKKVLFTFMMLFSLITANAQIATENSRLFDNTYVGVEVGAATPLNFDPVFPLNTIAGIKLGKEFTPVVGLEVEGQVFFNDNNVGRWTNTFVKGTNVTLAGTINLSNWFGGYKGTPRVFEVKTNTGIGWLHKWNSDNALSGKTGLDFNFNLGKKKAHTLSINPAVYWNLADNGRAVQFNKNYAQLAVFAGYTYHFKTSNKTHHFKTYDVGALLTQIDDLKGRMKNIPRRPRVVEKVVERVVTDTIKIDNQEYVVLFAYNSSELADSSKDQLNKLESGTVVTVLGFASPEGASEYNLTLSQARADAVSNYLKERGVVVESATGLGVQGETSNRIVIVRKK